MKPLVIGHRGVGRLAPENTAAAIKKALEIGVDIIEIDVQLTKDYEIVVFHDYELERVTREKGLVRNKTLEQMKTLDAGSYFKKRFSGETPIALEEAFKIINNKCELIIDIKDDDLNKLGTLAKQLIKKIKKSKFKKQIRISSWNHYVDKYVDKEIKKAGLKNVALAYLHRKRGSPLKNFGDLNYISIHPHFLCTTNKMIKEAHKNGLQVFPWKVSKKNLMKKLLKMGVDGIITDYPNRLQEVVNEFSKSTSKKR